VQQQQQQQHQYRQLATACASRSLSDCGLQTKTCRRFMCVRFAPIVGGADAELDQQELAATVQRVAKKTTVAGFFVLNEKNSL
jgi:hypothetical protein